LPWNNTCPCFFLHPLLRSIPPEITRSMTWNPCLLTYRLHNLWSFITDRPILCWGGCWIALLSIFRSNFGNLVDCCLDGGYSDGTIVSCIAQANGFVCAHPPMAIFPNACDPRIPMHRYWDFVKRQFFVTDTYSTPYNRSVVHSSHGSSCRPYISAQFGSQSRHSSESS
jgi:hypothetical protein